MYFWEKGFKFLDVSSGRVYTWRDVILMNLSFLLNKMHEDAGRSLHYEINLIRSTLLNPSDSGGITDFSHNIEHSGPDCGDSHVPTEMDNGVL